MINKDAFKKILKVLVAVLIGGGIIWLSVRKMSIDEWTEISMAFSQANYWWIGLSLIIAFISNISRSIRWQMLLKPMGYRPRFVNVMLSVLVAYFANLGLPRLGEVVRCGLLVNHEKIPFEKSFGTVITERMLDLIIFAILFLVNFILQFNKIHTYVEREIFSQFNMSFSGTLILLAAIGVAIVLLFLIFKKKLSKNTYYQKVLDILKGFLSGIKSISKLDKPFLFIFHSLFIWFCYWMMAYSIFQALPITSDLSILVSFSALAIGTIGMIIVQGGLGVYPLLIAGTLVSYGINYPSGYAMGWLLWGGQTLGIIIAGSLALVLIPILNKKSSIK